ncbi:hypothetical protein AMTRI_Chr01g103190 [Amborella trichopoda]
MKEQESYVPPQYIPLQQSDLDDGSVRGDETVSSKLHEPNTTQWSSGICACCDDIQSCCMGFMCPCYVFGKNAEFLGSGSWIGPCMIHFVMWGLFNGLCCLLTEGLYLGFPLSPASFYTYSYRKAIREKYNLPEAPCNDTTTHVFCQLCAICQEYREIRERSEGFSLSNLNLTTVSAPPVQKMESDTQN